MSTPRYMDKYGLEYYHNLIRKGLIEYIIGTQNEETSAWTGVSKSPSLFAGKVIIYHLPFAGTGEAATLTLTLPTGASTGAKAVQNETAGAVTTEYAADSDIFMVYTGSVWKCSAVDTTYAPLESPAFTGIPTAPTAEPDTSTNQIATTEFSTRALAAEADIRATTDEALNEEITDTKTRVDAIIAGTTTNASGWNVETLTQNVTVTGGTASYNFAIPEDATVLEVAVRSAASSSQPWITDNVNVYTNGTEAYVEADGLTVAEVVLKITYGKQDTINLPELTEIRLGADGTTYATAGEAVRGQVSDLKAESNYNHNSTLIIDNSLVTLGTEKQPSTTSAGWKILPSGSSTRDTDYSIFKYYLSPGSKWYVNFDDRCIWQLQGSSNVPSGPNTDIKGYTHVGAYEGFIQMPSSANYIMVSAPAGSTHTVFPFTNRIEEYRRYVAKDSQAVLTGEYPIYMEKADGYVYLYMGSIYIRSSLSKTYSISALGNIFTLETSPSGHPNCIKIPYGYSLVYDYDADTLSLASSFTQYSGYKCLLLGYFSTSGNLQGGLIYDRYLLELLDDTGIPTYFKSQIDTKVAEINANLSDVGTNGFTFAFVTDQHLPYNSGKTASIIKYLQAKNRMKYVVSGGDIIDVESTKQKALAELAEYCGEFSFLDVPMFSIMGNHDYNTETTQAVSGEDLTIQNFYGVAMRQMNDIVIYDDYLDYYYIDIQSNTALVFLQTGKTNGSYHLDQNVALASILPTLPDNVIIVSHLLVRTENGSPVTNANWNTLVNGSTAKPGLNGMSGKEKVKCIVCGHLHSDWTTFQDNFRLIVTDTNSYKPDPTTKGTVNELAFDVLTFDYTANTCKAVRIGRGADRSISLTS